MVRRRGVGIGRSKASGPKFSKKAEELKATSLESAIETVEKLQIKLADFANKHQSEIQHDPAFRQQFLQMCGPLGVDPLQSPKSFWAKALGVEMGDFYYELAVKVAEVCFATRSKNGGIIAVTEVHSTLNRTTSRRTKTKKQLYAIDDIPIAVKKLGALGGGFRIVTVGRVDMIVSVPTELDQDHMEIMSLAQNGEGAVTVDDVTQKMSWSSDRAERALVLLLQEGMAWKDDLHGISFYWFPSVWKEQQQMESDFC